MTRNTDYVMAQGADEERRLHAQARVLDPLTRRLFDNAGLTTGMRVLDLGSGAGDVAVVASQAVGPQGCVVGVDNDPAAVDAARRSTAGLANVELRVADVNRLDDVDDEFDAVVGRAVLMHLADPAGALRQAVRKVRPGGLVCMHEPDMTYLWTSVPTPLWDQVRAWIHEAFDRGGADSRMGLSLVSLFRTVGLADPRLMLEAPIGVGDDSPAYGWANIVAAVLPVLQSLGIDDAARVDTGTLAERLDAEIDARDGMVLGPPMIGAWTRTPLD